MMCTHGTCRFRPTALDAADVSLNALKAAYDRVVPGEGVGVFLSGEPYELAGWEHFVDQK